MKKSKGRVCLAFESDQSSPRSVDAFDKRARKAGVPLPRDYDDCRKLTSAQAKKAASLVRALPGAGYYLSRSR